jgi:23S rRNA pseudouridine2605 synthase
MEKKVYIGQKEWGKAEVVEQKQNKGRAIIMLRLYQGKKREIRRLMYRMKRKLFSLERIQFGPIELGNMPIGTWRDLKEREVKSLKKMNN